MPHNALFHLRTCVVNVDIQFGVVDSFCYYVTRGYCRCFKSSYSSGLGKTTDGSGSRMSTRSSGNVIVRESWASSKFFSESILDLV